MTFFQQTDGLGAAHRVGDAVDIKTGKQSGFLALALQGALHGHRVDDGSEHTHVVALDAVHAFRGSLQATIDVTSADDDADLHTRLRGFDDFVGIVIQSLRIDAVLLAAHEGFAAEFQ